MVKCLSSLSLKGKLSREVFLNEQDHIYHCPHL